MEKIKQRKKKHLQKYKEEFLNNLKLEKDKIIEHRLSFLIHDFILKRYQLAFKNLQLISQGTRVLLKELKKIYELRQIKDKPFIQKRIFYILKQIKKLYGIKGDDKFEFFLMKKIL